MFLLFKCIKGNEDFNGQTDFGLLIQEKIIDIHKSSEHTRVGVRINGLQNLSEIENIIDEISDKIRDISILEVLNSDSKIASTIKVVIESMNYQLGDIKKTVELYAKLIGEDAAKTNYYDCNLEYPAVTKEVFENIKDQIFILLDNFDFSTLKIDVKASQLKEFLNILYLVNDVIADNRDQLHEREVTIITLENGLVPEFLLLELELVNCIKPGTLQKEYLNFCKRDTQGLLCEIDIAIFRNTESYTILTPISYSSARIVAENLNQVFALDHSGHLGVLDCGDLQRDPYDPDDEVILADTYCNFKLYNNLCSLALTTDDKNDLIKHCNYTIEVPELVTRTLFGILVMNSDKNLIIKEVNTAKNAKIMSPTKTPVLIRTNNPIYVHSKDLEITIKPLKEIIERKIVYSRYSDDFIQEMVSAARKHDWFQDLDYLDYMVLSSVLALIFIIPVVCGMCIICMKNTACCQRMQNLPFRKIFKAVDQGRKNFEMNSRIFKKGIDKMTK
jgi:hypothetical protein